MYLEQTYGYQFSNKLAMNILGSISVNSNSKANAIAFANPPFFLGHPVYHLFFGQPVSIYIKLYSVCVCLCLSVLAKNLQSELNTGIRRASARRNASMIIMLSQFNCNYNCQLELSLAKIYSLKFAIN